jgi:hypothetical protein
MADRRWKSSPANRQCNPAPAGCGAPADDPRDQQWHAKVTHQGLQKVHYLFFFHRIRIDSRIEIPQRECGCDRQSLPIKVVLQDRGLSWGTHVRQRCGRWLSPLSSMKTSRRPSLSAFFSASHTFFFQRRICSSLRSRGHPSAAADSSPGRPESSRRGPRDSAPQTPARSDGRRAGRPTAEFHSPAARGL